MVFVSNTIFSTTLQQAPTLLYCYVHPLQGRLDWCDGVLNHQPPDCLLNRLSKAQIKETSKFHVTGFCERNSPVTGKFPAQRGSNPKNVSIWWRHHDHCVVVNIYLSLPRVYGYLTYGLMVRNDCWLKAFGLSTTRCTAKCKQEYITYDKISSNIRNKNSVVPCGSILFSYVFCYILCFPYVWIWSNIESHYSNVMISSMASQITSLTIVYSTVYSGADKRKHQSSA